MDIHSDNPAHGFQFPGEFELSAMGPAEAGLEASLPKLLSEAGVDVIHEDVSWKASSTGKYVSVRIRFRACNREDHERALLVLRRHPDVKWTL